MRAKRALAPPTVALGGGGLRPPSGACVPCFVDWLGIFTIYLFLFHTHVKIG